MVTYEQMKAAILEVAAQYATRSNGGRCAYTKLDTEVARPVANCVAAVVLHEKFDVPIGDLVDADSADETSICHLYEGSYSSILGSDGVPHPAVAGLSASAANLLERVQAHADSGGGLKPWRVAVDEARI